MWTKELLQEMVRKRLKDHQFIVLSNREPYIHKYIGGKINLLVPPGGLRNAIDPIMKACGGLWIGHGTGSADFDVVDSKGKIDVPPENPKYTLKRIKLTKEEEDGYYYGFSNEAFWPLCHIVYQKPFFDPRDFEYYVKVNKYFAEAVLEEVGSGKALVWIHDYHLALCAKFIKEQNPNITTAHFWHIPWPNVEAYRICPWREEILEGLLSNDLLGFHIRYHCRNFLETAERILTNVRVNKQKYTISYKGHKTVVKAFPISLDYQSITESARQINQMELQNKITTFLPNYEILCVSVDRIDYTKGIIERLKAIDRFLEKYPEYQGRFVHLGVGSPSRVHIKAYKSLTSEILALIEEINWRYQSGGWYPIHFIKGYTDFNDVISYYTISDLCIVSSLHDGMNMVAKEYVACCPKHKGMLILSHFTGAARELTDAILVNPYDIEGLCDAIKEAIEMNDIERRKRMDRLKRIVKTRNVYKWAASIILKMLDLDEKKNG